MSARDEPNPSCFISYSWEDEAHRNWVRMLAARLRLNGVDAHLDQYELRPGADLTDFMETRIRESRFVLLVCTPAFAAKANAGLGGVGYEKRIVTGELFHDASSNAKFVPLLRRGEPANALPSYLKSRLFLDFRDPGKLAERFEELLRHLHAAPEHVKPPLGPRPDFASTADLDGEGLPDAPPRSIRWPSLQPRYFEGFDFLPGDVRAPSQRLPPWLTPSSANPDPVWSTEVRQGLYWLENRTAADAVRYRHVGLVGANGEPVELGGRPVSVEVAVSSVPNAEPSPYSSAGLLCRFDASSRDYYAFTISGDGRHSFGRRTSAGYSVDFVGRSERFRPGFANKLGIVGSGSLVQLYLNDELVRSVGGLERRTGQTGIIASSVGRFGFDNFAIYDG